MAYADMRLEPPCVDLDRNAPAEELYKVGLAYAAGTGVAIDLVAAHKWFNLAAAKGSEAGKAARQDMADQMSADEVARAQRAAREWFMKAS